MNVVWTSVFPDGVNGGNPCPVVFDPGETDMQALAAEFGHETVFVLPAEHGGDAKLRFFVPAHEMEMCVHATIAAAVLLDKPLLRLETPLAIREVTVDGDRATVAMPAATIHEADGAALCAALGVPARTVHVVSTARAKTLVEVGDELDSLDPDYEALWAACDAMDSTGAYVFTRVPELSARQFPVRAGYPEDAATGVAASALAAVLAGPEPGWQEFSIAQGRAMGRPSRLFAAAYVEDGRVKATRVRGGVTVRT